ncbi:MAG: phage replisome organizer N-terminal domain-containing protein [Clostridia bacterium]|nr:phage replisome organizer N-terminal domain-containing protein [Clostridia bacterium]
MNNNKKYYWLRLKEGFFDSKHIKFLRSQNNGDRMCIVYLQLQLKSLKTIGVVQYEKLLPSCTEEIAFDLGEPIEIINQTVAILEKLNLVEQLDDGSLYLSAVREVVGSETAAAECMRNKRMRDNSNSDNTNPFSKYV